MVVDVNEKMYISIRARCFIVQFFSLFSPLSLSRSLSHYLCKQFFCTSSIKCIRGRKSAKLRGWTSMGNSLRSGFARSRQACLQIPPAHRAIEITFTKGPCTSRSYKRDRYCTLLFSTDLPQFFIQTTF